MIFLKNRLLLISIVSVAFTNCSTPTVEKKYDELDKKMTCRLNNFNMPGPISLILDMQEDGNVLVFLTVHSHNYLTNMHTNPKIMFKFYSPNKQIEELTFHGVTKNWPAEDAKAYEKHRSPELTAKIGDEIIKRQLIHSVSLPLFIGGSSCNYEYASTSIDKTTFSKIAHANKVDIFVQTNHDPVRATLLNEELEPFREFKKVCFYK